MPIYLLTPLNTPAAEASAIVEERIQPHDRYPLQNNASWLISYAGTSVELSKHLGITGFEEGAGPTLQSVLITSIGSYYGRGPSDMWEWLVTRVEGQP